MDILSQYFVKKRSGGEFLRAFYDLALVQKKIILALMEDAGLLESDTVKHRAANAILMHYKGDQYPVTGIKRLSKAAKDADAQWQQTTESDT